MRVNPQTLGGREPHIFVTRGAVLSYQELMQERGLLNGEDNFFEATRRALTLRLMSATPDPNVRDAYLVPVKGNVNLTLRARTVRDGALIVITKISAAAPGLCISEPAGYTPNPARKRRFKPTDYRLP